MQKLIMMVGIPGSGKSTYAKKLEDENNIVLSTDAIRGEVYGDEAIQKDHKQIYQLLFSRAKQALAKGKNVILDATYSNIYDRQRTLDAFSDLNLYRVAIVISTPLKECLKRNKNRDRVVEEDVIRRYYNGFEFPTKNEGFDEIIVVEASKFNK